MEVAGAEPTQLTPERGELHADRKHCNLMIGIGCGLIPVGLVIGLMPADKPGRFERNRWIKQLLYDHPLAKYAFGFGFAAVGLWVVIGVLAVRSNRRPLIAYGDGMMSVVAVMTGRVRRFALSEITAIVVGHQRGEPNGLRFKTAHKSYGVGLRPAGTTWPEVAAIVEQARLHALGRHPPLDSSVREQCGTANLPPERRKPHQICRSSRAFGVVETGVDPVTPRFSGVCSAN